MSRQYSAPRAGPLIPARLTGTPPTRLDEAVAALPGLAAVRWQGAVDAHAAMAAVNEIADGSEYPMLVEMATVEAVNRQARAVFSIPSAASRIALLGSGPVGSRSRNRLLRRARPPLPHPLFQFPDRIH
jgi:hypothetical protein